MKRRVLSVVWCLVLLRISAVAQSTAPADLVSGNWGAGGTTLLELKFDGKAAVSGTVAFGGGGQQAPAPIKTGTFDLKTGALKLEGEGTRPDGVTVRYVIEGTLRGDAITGTYVFGDRKGPFTFTRQGGPIGTVAPSRFFSGPDSVPGDEFVAAVNVPAKNAKATGTLFIASSVRRVRAVIVLTERGPRTPMAAQGRFGDTDWRRTSEKCACGLLHFRLDTIRPVPDVTLPYNVLRNAAIGGGDTLVDIMDRLARETGRSELQSAPFVFWGWSAAATFGPSFAQQHADRTAAFIAYHAQLTAVDGYLDALKRIPALLINGGKDNTSGTADAERLWTAARADNAPWAFAVEPNAPHADEQTLMASHSLMLPWIVAIVDKRLGNDSSKLRDVLLSGGLLIDQTTGQIQRDGGTQGARPLSSWLPDEESARGWQVVSGKSK